MSKMRGGGPEKRRAVPKKERHGSLFLYRDNQTTRPRTHLGSITQLWWRRGIRKGESVREGDSCRFNPLLCLRIVPSSGVFVRRQISMCAAFVRLPLYTRPTITYKALVSLWQNIAKMVSWWFLGMERSESSQIKGPQRMILVIPKNAATDGQHWNGGTHLLNAHPFSMVVGNGNIITQWCGREQCGTSCHQELFGTSW